MAWELMTNFILFAALTCWRVSNSARIEIQPVSFDGLVKTAVNITCAPEERENSVKEIVGIQILRGEQQMASLRQGSEVVYGTDLTTSVQAEGRIVSNVSQCFLRLTMPHVLIRDSGKYTCSMHFVDEVGFLDVDSIWDNLVVDDQDIQNHLAFLIKKVFVQGNLIKEQSKQINNQATQHNKLQQDLKHEATYISAFSASAHKTTYSETANDVVVFGNVVTKTGRGYDENTGLFTAPYRGLYAFSLSIYLRRHGMVDFKLMANGSIVVRIRAGDPDHYDHSSASCVVYLEVGHIVKPVIEGMSLGSLSLDLMDANNDSLFSGYLIKAM